MFGISNSYNFSGDFQPALSGEERARVAKSAKREQGLKDLSRHVGLAADHRDVFVRLLESAAAMEVAHQLGHDGLM